MMSIYLWPQVDHIGLATDLCQSRAHHHVTSDQAPVDSGILKQGKDRDLYELLGNAFEALETARKEGQPPILALVFFLCTFGEFFNPSDGQDLRGGDYAFFLVILAYVHTALRLTECL